MRFVESLADWLQQFSQEDRGTAYEFVRNSLVYVSTGEMNHLVELFYPETVVWRLQQELVPTSDSNLECLGQRSIEGSFRSTATSITVHRTQRWCQDRRFPPGHEAGLIK